MSSKKKYDLVAKVGEYELNGEKKARWFTCGAVFENEKGQLSAKLNGIPVGVDWNGWLNLSIPNEQRSGGQSPSASSNAKASTIEDKAEAKTEAKKDDLPTIEDKDPDNLPF
jgi:hypothetical protein